jgi:hypothetical protein
MFTIELQHFLTSTASAKNILLVLQILYYKCLQSFAGYHSFRLINILHIIRYYKKIDNKIFYKMNFKINTKYNKIICNK